MVLVVLPASPPHLHPPHPSYWMKHSSQGKISSRCCMGQAKSSDDGISRNFLPWFAASVVFLSPPSQVLASESSSHHSLCQLATATVNGASLKFDDAQDEGNVKLMMSGMSAKKFDPVRYSGIWFEVASLKHGFAGQGPEDYDCTQAIYTFDAQTPSIQVNTFCVHGGPDGYITSIRGNFQCISEEDLEKTETDLERKEMIREKCFLCFPTLPFIPKEPYDVIAMDYDIFACLWS